MIELGALLLLAHSLAHVAGITIAGRRILLETGLRRGLDGIRTQHTVYLPDLIGFGRSPKPRGAYSLGMHLDALTPILRDADGPITVVGHSMGAIVALGLYARFPDRVERVTLSGLPYFPSRELAEASLADVSLMNQLVIRRSWLAPGICYLKDLLGLPIFAPIAGMPVDLYRDYWKHTWASFSRSLFNTLLGSDVAGLFASVDRTRVSLIHGKHDPIAPIDHVRSLVDRFPDLALRELKGGHHLYLMYPRLLNRLMTDGEQARRREAKGATACGN